MNESVNKLLGERYFLSGEQTWNDIAKRVGEVYPEATKLIEDMKFIPSTPTLMNANTKGKRKGGLSSCFVMDIKDSIDGIFDSLKEAAIVTKNAGGVGYDFSRIRASTEEIKSLDGRLSSGPLPFADMFNSMLDGIRQGGARKGAGMLQLDITHPNILEFIEAKRDWKSQRLNRFNLSIRIPNWFYDKLEMSPDEVMMVKNVTDEKSFPLKSFDGKDVTIKMLWNKIIESAHMTAEPGILNSDTMFNQCSVTNVDTRVGTNPCCVIGSTIVETQYGKERIEDLVGKSVKVWTYNIDKKVFELETITNAWKSGENVEVYELELEDGKKIILTKEHRVLTTDGYIEAQFLTLDHQILSI